MVMEETNCGDEVEGSWIREKLEERIVNGEMTLLIICVRVELW